MAEFWIYFRDRVKGIGFVHETRHNSGISPSGYGSSDRHNWPQPVLKESKSQNPYISHANWRCLLDLKWDSPMASCWNLGLESGEKTKEEDRHLESSGQGRYVHNTLNEIHKELKNII